MSAKPGQGQTIGLCDGVRRGKEGGRERERALRERLELW